VRGKARLLVLGISFLLVGADDVSQSRAFDAEGKVAIVCFLQGKASIQEPGQSERIDLRLFDWLNSGSALETGPGTKLVMAFSNGNRYELGERVKVVLGQADFISQSGPVKKLDAVSVMPQIISLAGDVKPGSRLGGIRLRSSKRTISNLYPNEGDAVLADQAVLTFDPLPDVEKYRVEIEDEQGRDLLSAETSVPRVIISPGIIKPGTNYYWQVRALEKDELSTVSYAAFITVTEEQAGLRNSFRAQVSQSRDAANLLLLARVELAIGLRRESCETLNEALSLSPDNEEIRGAMAQLGCEQK
jgi:hypothetical protein